MFFLKNKVRFYQILSIVFFLTSVISIGISFFRINQSSDQERVLTVEDLSIDPKKVPSYKEIMNLIKPLRYSGVQAILREEVDLEFNFLAQEWRLKNLHRFDTKGNIILDGDRDGLCGELAAFVYPQVQAILGSRYKIEYASVSESGFFLQPQSSHVVLIIHDQVMQETFLLDPSFKRYGPVENFENYLYFEVQDSLPFFEKKEKDVFFPVNSGTPVLISKDRMAFLMVDSIDGVFNKDNFIISLTATRRYGYSGRYIYAVRKVNGQFDFFENKSLAEKIFIPSAYKKLSEKILFWATKN